jgi:hypothetical protein
LSAGPGGDAMDVDGRIYVSLKPGQVFKAEINGAGPYDLTGVY